MLLLEIGLKSLCATVVLLQMGHFCWKAKTCPKHRAQQSCCWKLASKHSPQLLFCLKLVTFLKKLTLVQNLLRNCPVARNWRQNTAQLSFCYRLATFVNNLKLVQNTVRKCPVAWNWPLLLKSKTLRKTKCATVLLLEISVKKLCATVVLLETGHFC